MRWRTCLGVRVRVQDRFGVSIVGVRVIRLGLYGLDRGSDIATERATLPPAQEVRRLDVEPPGAEPMSTTPIATRDGRPKAWARPNITGGMSRNCENIPIRKARRFVVHT